MSFAKLSAALRRNLSHRRLESQHTYTRSAHLALPHYLTGACMPTVLIALVFRSKLTAMR